MALIIVIVIVVVFSGFGSLVWYAFRFEVANFQLSNNNIYLKSERDNGNPDKISSIKAENIAGSKAPLKILHLSDFHLRADFKGQKLAGFIKILSFESYDFIFITGDMVEKDGLQNKLIETLKPLKAKYGIYAVFGAHDYFNKKPAEFIKNMFKKKESYSRKNDVAGLRRKLESIGIKVLQNESLILKGVAGYDEIDIVGVDDPLIDKMDLKKSLSGIFQNDEDIKIINVSPESLSLKDSSNTQGYKDSKLISSSQSENGEFEYQKNQYLINSEKIIKTKEYKEAFGLSLNKYHSLGESKKLKIALIHTPDSYALVNLA
ncbi:MAG: metallophosphoesterase, partial [Candidatus Humimicrobiaceae bacterium]